MVGSSARIYTLPLQLRSQFGQQTRSDVSEFGAASSADEDNSQFSRIRRLRTSSWCRMESLSKIIVLSYGSSHDVTCSGGRACAERLASIRFPTRSEAFSVGRGTQSTVLHGRCERGMDSVFPPQ